MRPTAGSFPHFFFYRFINMRDESIVILCRLVEFYHSEALISTIKGRIPLYCDVKNNQHEPKLLTLSKFPETAIFRQTLPSLLSPLTPCPPTAAVTPNLGGGRKKRLPTCPISQPRVVGGPFLSSGSEKQSASSGEDKQHGRNDQKVNWKNREKAMGWPEIIFRKKLENWPSFM